MIPYEAANKLAITALRSLLTVQAEPLLPEHDTPVHNWLLNSYHTGMMPSDHNIL